MFQKLKNLLPSTKLESSRQLIEGYNHNLSKEISGHKYIFQQDIVENIREAEDARMPTEDSIDLSSIVCAGVCYWTALSLLGIESRDIISFIEDVYDPSKGIKHPLGLNHVNFVKYLGKTHNRMYGLTLNPFREQDPSRFKEYKGYAGKGAEEFFLKNYRQVNSTSTAAKQILGSGGLPVISIQGSFNTYSPNFHDILILGLKDKSFLIMDPDARVYFDPQKTRPKEVRPIPGYPGLYLVDSGYIDKNTYREKPSPGGITIGLFSS